jgi:hypothetical protein
MSARGSKANQISIRVEKNRITLGEKNTCAVKPGSQIEWICHHPFAVQFDGDAPFKLVSRGAKTLTMGFKAGAHYKPLHPYKYTLAALVKGKVLLCDPFIIIVPAQWADGGKFLSVIIVKPPRG